MFRGGVSPRRRPGKRKLTGLGLSGAPSHARPQYSEDPARALQRRVCRGSLFLYMKEPREAGLPGRQLGYL